MSAMEETLRSTVGRDAEVPRKRRVSDMTAKYTGTGEAGGNALCLWMRLNQRFSEEQNANENCLEDIRTQGWRSAKGADAEAAPGTSGTRGAHAPEAAVHGTPVQGCGETGRESCPDHRRRFGDWARGSGFVRA